MLFKFEKIMRPPVSESLNIHTYILLLHLICLEFFHFLLGQPGDIGDLIYSVSAH